MKKSIFIILLFGSFLFAQNAEFNFSQINYGAFNNYASAKQLALGNSGLAGGDALSALYLNPALATKTTRFLDLNAGVMMNLVEEDRAYPYYDTFGGFTDYGSYFFNKNWYPNYYGAVHIRLSLPYVKKSVLSLGFLPFLDYSYNYLEEVGFPNTSPEYKKDKILGYNSIDNEGSLNLIPVGLSFMPLDQLSVGIQVGVLTGAVDYKKSMVPVKELFSDEEYAEIYSQEEVENALNTTPVVSSLGLNYNLNERLALAMSARLPFTVKYDQSTTEEGVQDTAFTSDYSLTYPMQLGFGLEYRFTNILEARILLDFIYDFWSKFEDSRIASLDYYDTYSLRVGVEHNFFDQVPLRVGFSYSTLRESRDFSKTLLSVGSGVNIKELAVNFALGFSSFQYYQYDMFDDAAYGMLNRGTELDRVQVSEFFGRIDFTYAFDLGSKK